MVEAVELRKWLAVKDETLRREFKLKYVLKGQGNTKHRDELAKDVMALANTAGRTRDDYAYLIIGAGDKLKADGTRDRDEVRAYGYSRKSILDTVNAKCYPSLPDLAYEEVEVDGNHYGVVIVPPSPSDTNCRATWTPRAARGRKAWCPSGGATKSRPPPSRR